MGRGRTSASVCFGTITHTHTCPAVHRHTHESRPSLPPATHTGSSSKPRIAEKERSCCRQLQEQTEQEHPSIWARMTRVSYSYRECSSEAPRGWPFWQRGAEDGKPFRSKTGREGPHCPSPTGHLTPPGLGEDEGTVALPSQLHRGSSTGCMNTVVPWLVVLNQPLPRSPREQHALPPTSLQLPVLVSVFLCMERNKADCPSRPVCLCCWAQGAPNKLGGGHWGAWQSRGSVASMEHSLGQAVCPCLDVVLE